MPTSSISSDAGPLAGVASARPASAASRAQRDGAQDPQDPRAAPAPETDGTSVTISGRAQALAAQPTRDGDQDDAASAGGGSRNAQLLRAYDAGA